MPYQQCRIHKVERALGLRVECAEEGLDWRHHGDILREVWELSMSEGGNGPLHVLDDLSWQVSWLLRQLLIGLHGQ